MHTLNPEPSENMLSPGKERIRQVKTYLTSDVRRIKVDLELDPFQKPPNLELQILDPSGQETSRAEIIETMSRKMELNLHLRLQPFAGEYTLNVTLYSSEIQLEDQPSENQGDDRELDPIQRRVVDSWVEKFIIR